MDRQVESRDTRTGGAPRARRGEKDPEGGAGRPGGVRQEVEARAREASDEVRETARRMRDRGREEADHLSSRAGRRTVAVARAIRSAGGTLRDEGEPWLADWTDSAADEVEAMGTYLDDERPSAMLGDLEDLARRHPPLFLGGALAAGVLVGRFLRSSEPPQRGDGAAEGRVSPQEVTAAVGSDQPPEPRGSDYHGDSRPERWSAPASAGETLGSTGVTTPEGDPDLRPAHTRAPDPHTPTDETPVRSPAGGAGAGRGTGTSSASLAGRTTSRPGGEDAIDSTSGDTGAGDDKEEER